MAKFNLDDYENVKSRKKRFYDAYEDGRIVVDLINQDLEEKAVVKAYVYKNDIDQNNNNPMSTGYALEMRDKELLTSNSGKQYESVNFSSWLENCEESAIGRALDNAGFASNLKCSREEILKMQRHVALGLNKKLKSELSRLTDDFKDVDSLADIFGTFNILNKEDLLTQTIERKKEILLELSSMK